MNQKMKAQRKIVFHWLPSVLSAVVLFLLTNPAWCQEEPPIAGPEDFSQIVGFYRISSSASPMQLSVEDSLTLRIRITGEGPSAYRPQRRNLRVFPKQLADDFYLEALADQDRYLEKEKTWEFVYRLRPRHLEVKNIPSLKLVYYLPARQRFQSTYAAAIPLTVKPRPEVEAPAEALQTVQPPPRFHELAGGPALLRRQGTSHWHLAIFLGVAIAAPILCALWYGRWRRLHPDAGQLVVQNRSRAARQALRTLQLEKAPDRIAHLVTTYLRQRVEFPALEATGIEVSQHLFRLGVTKSLRGKFADFFQACDSCRFAPPGVPSADQLAHEAGKLVQALEAEACSNRVS